MDKSEEALDAAKETVKKGLRYMCREGVQKTLIARVVGQEIVKIYERRGFVEIEKEEFNRLVKVLKEGV